MSTYTVVLGAGFGGLELSTRLSGLTIWFPRNTFVGSHLPLMPASRVDFASP